MPAGSGTHCGRLPLTNRSAFKFLANFMIKLKGDGGKNTTHNTWITQKFFNRFGDQGPGGEPIFQPIKVEAHNFLAVIIRERVVATNLLQILPISGSFVVRGHDPIERPVGAAAECQTDDDAQVVVLCQQRAP